MLYLPLFVSNSPTITWRKLCNPSGSNVQTIPTKCMLTLLSDCLERIVSESITQTTQALECKTFTH